MYVTWCRRTCRADACTRRGAVARGVLTHVRGVVYRACVVLLSHVSWYTWYVSCSCHTCRADLCTCRAPAARGMLTLRSLPLFRMRLSDTIQAVNTRQVYTLFLYINRKGFLQRLRRFRNPSMAGVLSPLWQGAFPLYGEVFFPLHGRCFRERDPLFPRFSIFIPLFSFLSMDRMHVSECNRMKGMRLTGWTNAHMVRAALRFCRTYNNENRYTYTFGQLNNKEEVENQFKFLDIEREDDAQKQTESR